MLISFKNGQTSVILRVKLFDSSVSTGAGKTGLTNSSSGLIISTIADNESAATVYTQAASHIQTIATLGTYSAPSASNCRFGEVDSTNHPGIYEIQIADARFGVSNAKSLLVSISGVASLAQTDVVIPLTGFDPYDAVRGGMSALPNTACTSNASLITSGSGTDQLTVSGGIASADAKKINAVSTSSVTTINANVGTTQPTNFSGTGASAFVQSDLKTILGTASAGAAGYVGTDQSKITNPTATVDLSGTTISGTDNGVTLTNTGIDAILDRTAGIETNMTLRQGLRLILAALAGKLSGGATTTVTIRDTNDTKNRLVATVDASGDRSSITYDVS